MNSNHEKGGGARTSGAYRYRFTVFTPTFNRADTLSRVYDSLSAQTFDDFEWLIIDDGSTDGTRKLVTSWQHDSTFPIRYLHQPNAGKHLAHNWAVEEALGAISTPGVAAIQHPLSVLDQRFVRAGVLDRAAEAGVAVFARSVYLQGLVTMDIKNLPEPVTELGPTLVQLRGLEPGLAMEELAIRYVASLAGVTGVVVGMETHEQLERNLDAILEGPLGKDLLDAIARKVPDLREDLINPGLWGWMREYDFGRS